MIHWFVCRPWLTGLLLGLPSAALAQTDRPYLMQTMPYPVYSYPEPANYNLKWGKLIARIEGNVQFEFNDNINLAKEGRIADISIAPMVTVGFILPTSRENVLTFDVGFGYRWYLNTPSVSSLNLAPRSRLDYRIFMDDVQINLHDNFTIHSDPLTQVYVKGQAAQPLKFRRFINTVGAIGEWRPWRQWGFLAGYDYTLDRSLSSEFLDLDYDSHTFMLGAYYMPSSRFTVGLNGSVSLIYFRNGVQNDGGNWNVGPFATWQVTQFISLDASLSYTETFFGDSGLLPDRSNYQGLSFQLSARHRMNSTTTQTLRVGHSIGTGYGGNYTENWGIQYSLITRLTRGVSLNSMLSYDHYRVSQKGGDYGDRYLVYLGTGLQLDRKWDMGLGYTFSWNESGLGYGYYQNRVVIDLHRKF
ncbi:MAG: hypothetical protein WCO56_01140 [Verrucomicrobiota bacterium]